MTICLSFSYTLDNYTEEDLAFFLSAAFNSAVEILDDKFRVYLEKAPDDLPAITKELANRDLIFLDNQNIPDENWVQNCQDLFEPLNFSKLNIRYLSSDNNLPELEDKQLFIIPGTGFGTGHHQTTKSITAILNDFSDNYQYMPSNVLDLGCGSALLALVAEKLFDCNVDAVDNDALALENAKINLEINNSKKVKVILGEIESCKKGYDLILANLYAEILCKYSTELLDLLIPGKILICSGIMTEKGADFKASFNQSSWLYLNEIEKDNWLTFILRKK